MNIVLKKCVLREWHWEDKKSLIKNANNPKIARMVKDRFPCPYDVAAADHWRLIVVKIRKKILYKIPINKRLSRAFIYRNSKRKKEI